MLFMIVERFKNSDAKPVYERLFEKGRLIPVGLEYVSSWVDDELKVCFQLMETEERKLIDEWISDWDDIVDFEVFPVNASEEAAKLVNEK